MLPFRTQRSNISPDLRFGPNALGLFWKVKEKNPFVSNKSPFVHVKTITDKRMILYNELKGQKGAFATEDIKRGTKLCYWTGTLVSGSEWKCVNWKHHAYVMRMKGGKGGGKWYIIPTYNGVAEFINDGRRKNKNEPSANNAVFVQEDCHGCPLVAVYATHKIKKGAQIFANYGNKHWEHCDKYKGK